MNLREECANWIADLPAYVTEVEASKLDAFLRETNPDGYFDALQARGAVTLAEIIGEIRRHDRRLARTRFSARSFAEAVEAGAVEVDLWRTSFMIEDGTQKWLGEMVGADHNFVAGLYELTAAEAKFEAAFHRAVAKKVGTRKTSDVFTRDQYLNLRASLHKRPDAAA